MKILVTGVKGQLGYDVVKELEKRGHEVYGTDVDNMDITDGAAVEKTIKAYMPDAVIHCAAYTAVDNAEDNVDICRKINKDGTENIARACKKTGAKMIYISTDYVFDGQGTRPWEPEDKAAPLNVYGLTKYEGELAVQKYLDRFFIVRIAWVFGINGKNFIKTMLRIGREKGAVSVVKDQFGSPTYTYDLARLLADMVQSESYGIYHATNEGDFCSWYEFACFIFEAAGMDVDVTPVTSDEFPVKAKRPENSRLSKEKLSLNGFERLPLWKDAVKRYVDILEKDK